MIHRRLLNCPNSHSSILSNEWALGHSMGAAVSDIHLPCAFPQESYSYDFPDGKGLLSYVSAVRPQATYISPSRIYS